MEEVSKKTEQEIRDIIFQFLNPEKYKVFIFGSRAIGKAKKFSDYDIGIIAHTYNEKMADKVYRQALKFPQEIDNLLKKF